MNIKDAKVSVFKDLFKSTDVPYVLPLWKSLERIKQGKSKELIDKIREGKKELKTKLPSILFAGEFSIRNSKSLKNHSGLMVLDFDKYPSPEDLKIHFELLKQNEHFVSLFISPSGNGIKAVLRVPNSLTAETHPKYFKAFQNEYNYDYFDVSNSNVDRVCFESYDPNIYINYEAVIYQAVVENEGHSKNERVPIFPISNEDFIIEKIMKWNWGKDFVEGERNAFIYDIAGAFCEYGVSQSTAEAYIINNVIIGEFSEREANTTIKSAYRSREFNSKYFEDYNKLKRVQSDLSKGRKKVIDKYNIDEKTYDLIKEVKESEDFWYYDNKGKPKIDNLRFKEYLESNGFKKYYPDGNLKPIWVYVQSNIVCETSPDKIKDFVLNDLIQMKEFDIWNYCTNYAKIFTDNFLNIIESIELKMLKDTRTKSFIAFKNGILEVSKDEAKLIEYLDVDGYIWESQIIKRNFKITKDHTNEYQKFVSNISHESPFPIECSIGYLLSTYKNKMNNKAIILNDEVISDNPEGGTGKGLFVQGLRQIRKVSIIDGKSHDDKKSFAYQTVAQDSQIIVFDDVKKNFDFEGKFSLVTEGLTIERKGKDAIKLSVEESPKMVISTNYAIRGEGNSHDRRRHELEIAQHYGKKKTPYDEFGRQLFDDWSDDDYLKYDNYMVYCLQSYLKNGLVEQNAKNLKKRKLIAETSMEFVDWVEDADFFKLDTRHIKSALFESFTSEYKDYQKYLSRKKFNIWIKKFSNYKDYKFVEGNSNGERWLEVIQPGSKKQELEGIEF